MPHSLSTQADRAVTAVHELAHLTRPAITRLDVGDLRTLTGALAELAAGLPQTLNQLGSYLDPADDPTLTGDQSRGAAVDHARTHLRHAGAAAAHLAAALDTAHQTLGDIAETDREPTKGVNFQPAIRGQFSTGVDTRGDHARGEFVGTPCSTWH
jgi:hypothetical protein